MGSHVGTASRDDRNDTGLTDLEGLNLFAGCALWCHFLAERDIEAINQFRATVRVPVVALPEDSGLTVDFKGVAAIGPGRVVMWRGLENTAASLVRTAQLELPASSKPSDGDC